MATIAAVTEPTPPSPDDPRRDIVQQPVQHQPVSARVPEKVSRGVMSTGQVILDSPKEFMIDFLQGRTRPHQVVARVIMTPATMQEFLNALQQNVQRYTDTYGPPPTLNIPSPQNRPTIQEIYENFKLPEDVMTGSYCNSVLIGHSATDFFCDFIASFYPTPAVSARVIIQAGMIGRFQNTLNAAMQQYRQRYGNRPPE